MFEEYDLEKEFKDYTIILKALIENRQTILMLKKAVEKQEGLIYTDIHMTTDANGKSVYKNEEMRQYALKEQMREFPAYIDLQKQKQTSIELELKFEQAKVLLGLLQQEREFKMKTNVEMK